MDQNQHHLVEVKKQSSSVGFNQQPSCLRFRHKFRFSNSVGSEHGIDGNLKPNDDNEENGSIQIYPSRGSRKPLSFEFDGILAPSTTQQQTFSVIAKNVIDDVLNGYNSTIACYGNTNSGKTHTIFGKEASADPHQMGLLPRCVAYCIHSIKSSPDIIEASITISCIEVYQEQLKDLISPSSSSKLKIRRSPSGETYVENLTQQFMQSANDALKMLEVIKLNRTKLSEFSEYSSHKSHSLACLTVRQKLSDSTSRKAKCYFVDFAGSDQDDVSLSNLQLIIHSLVAKKTQIAYNKSAITTILRESFGGNAKTLLIVCCSMHIFEREQAIKTLRFGQRARLIVNRIKSNKELSKNDMRRIIKKQEAVIASLQSQINENGASKLLDSNGKNDNNVLKQKYDKLLQQHSMDKVKYMAQNDELQDLQTTHDGVLHELNNLRQRESKMNEVCKQQKNEIIALQQENANYLATNAKLQNISSTILKQLATLEKELEIQQNAIKLFDASHSRGSVHRRLSDQSDDANNNNDDMARGSVIIHKLITLPLSTTEAANDDNDDDDDDIDYLDAVSASHIKIKESLFNLRQLLETNFASSSSHSNSKANNKKAMTQLVKQYNNVMVC